MSEPIYRLQTFAGLSAWRASPETPVLVGQRKRLALLATLAADGNGGVSRDRLLTLFWPEADATRARNALKQLVHTIRRDVGADIILDANGTLSLAPELVDSDIQRFRAALKAGELSRAVEIYRGPFLDGVYLKDGPEFERWVDECRQRFAGEHVGALVRLVESALEADEAPAAVPWARALASVDSLGTRSVLLCIRALEAAGDRGAAIKQGELHARLLRQELDAPPPIELERALRDLRQPHMGASETGSPTTARREHGAQTSAGDAADPDEVIAAPVLPREIIVADSPPRPTRGRFWSTRRTLWTTALACAALAIVAATRRATAPRLDARRVVIASFDNETGDSTLDDFGRIAAEVITEQLARAGFVNVIDPVTALASSQQVRSAGPRLTTQAALQMLATSTHAGLVVTGSYFREGEDLVAQARVTNAATNDVLAATEPVRGPRGNRDQLIEPLRQRVMGALAARVDERLAADVPAGNTPTYESYQAFMAGLEIFTSGRYMKSVPYLKRAYALDTTFMEPLIWEAEAPIPSLELHRIADILEQHRAGLSELDRCALDYQRALLADRLDKAAVVARNAASLAPGSTWPGKLATLLFRLGRVNEALDVWSTIDREHGWLRRSPVVWGGYIWVLHDAGDHREELKRAREARALFPESAPLLQAEVIGLAMNHEWREFDQRLTVLEQQEPDLLATVGSELRVHGDRDRATAVFDRLVNAFARRPQPNDSAAAVNFEANRAHALSAAGRWTEAARLLDSLDSDARQPGNIRPMWVLWRAIAHARTGDRSRATAVLDSVAGDSTANIRDLYNAARLAAALGDRTRAVTFLRPLRSLPGYWQHYNPDAGDFDSLLGYPPFETLRAGR